MTHTAMMLTSLHLNLFLFVQSLELKKCLEITD